MSLVKTKGDNYMCVFTSIGVLIASRIDVTNYSVQTCFLATCAIALENDTYACRNLQVQRGTALHVVSLYKYQSGTN